MIKNTYFKEVYDKYNNGFWINNPTKEQVDLAITAGSIGCTTNPTYSSKMLESDTDGEALRSVLMDILKTTDDDCEAARLIQRESILPLLEKFLPIYKKSMGKHGFVSIQGDPFAEGDPDMIINEALEDMKLGSNVIAKIPVTESGLNAIGYLVTKNIPIIATEIMSISQAIKVCEIYKESASKSGNYPALFVTHITGIFDDYIKNKADELGLNIPDEIMKEAGLIVARKQYSIMKKLNCKATLLGGGARNFTHFTGLVGGSVDITINWKGTADEILSLSPEPKDMLHTPINQDYVKFLSENLPDYEIAFEPDALKVEDYESYGPVVLFRNSFLKGWQNTLDIIKELRNRI